MRTELLVAQDLFEKNDCFTFKRGRAEKLINVVPSLAAVCALTSEPALPRSLELMDRASAECLCPLLFDNERLASFKLWLFVAHGPWQPNTAVVRHKRLWNSLAKKWKDAFPILSEEVAVESRDGIRYVGLAEVGRSAFAIAVQVLRQESSCALVLSPQAELPERGTLELFKDAFCPRDSPQPKAGVDWLNLALQCAIRQDMVIQTSGSWDERESALHIILPTESLPLFDSWIQSKSL